jgi:hypothetical protein
MKRVFGLGLNLSEEFCLLGYDAVYVVVICQGLLCHPHPRDLQLDAAGTPKRLFTSNRLHGVISQETVF